MIRRADVRRYLLLSIVSLLVLLLIMLFSSPIKNIIFALPFFAVLFVFLLSLGHLLTYLRRGEVTPKSRSWIVIISVFAVLLLMFKSAQSLSWVDAVILVLVVLGLLFYTSRRV